MVKRLELWAFDKNAHCLSHVLARLISSKSSPDHRYVMLAQTSTRKVRKEVALFFSLSGAHTRYGWSSNWSLFYHCNSSFSSIPSSLPSRLSCSLYGNCLSCIARNTKPASHPRGYGVGVSRLLCIVLFNVERRHLQKARGSNPRVSRLFFFCSFPNKDRAFPFFCSRFLSVLVCEMWAAWGCGVHRMRI